MTPMIRERWRKAAEGGCRGSPGEGHAPAGHPAWNPGSDAESGPPSRPTGSGSWVSVSLVLGIYLLPFTL